MGKDGVKPVDMLLAPLDSRNFAETGNDIGAVEWR